MFAVRSLTRNENIGFTFLIVFDFSNTSYKALDFLIKLVKTVGGSIEILCVVEPIDVVAGDNQIAALGAIAERKHDLKIKLNSIIEIIELEGIEVKTFITIGHVHLELESQLTKTNPFSVVIGEIKSGALGKATKYLLNKFKGNLLIIRKESQFLNGSNIVLGCNRNAISSCSLDFAAIYGRLTNKQLVLFNAEEPQNNSLTKSNQLNSDLPVKHKENRAPYFMSDLKKHVAKNNVELLCIGRNKIKKTFFDRIFKSHNAMLKTIENFNVPILIMENK